MFKLLHRAFTNNKIMPIVFRVGFFLIFLFFLTWTIFSKDLKPGYYMPIDAVYQADRQVSKKTILKHVRVADVDYAIPVGFFKDLIPEYIEDISIYLAVMRQDFSMLPDSPQNLIKEGRLSELQAVLALSEHRTIGINNFARKIIQGHNRTQKISKIENGLNLYVTPDGSRKDWGLHYTYEENGSIKAFIICREAVTPHGQSTCTHYFSDENLVFELSYSQKTELKKWREIEFKTRKLFAGFRKNAQLMNLKKVKISSGFSNPLIKKRTQ